MNKINLVFICQHLWNQTNILNGLKLMNFLFSFLLQSNGRVNGMIKYNVTDLNKGYWRYDNSNLNLISFDGISNIHLFKEINKSRCFLKNVRNDYFAYQFTGKIYTNFNFTLKQFIFIQMI